MEENYNAFDEPDRLLFKVSCGFFILLCWYLELSAYQWGSALLGFIVVALLASFMSGLLNLSSKARVFAYLLSYTVTSLGVFTAFS